MGQSSLQGNRKATLEIQIAFLASAAAALCDAERSPWVYSGGGSVELVADVSCDLAVCDLPPVQSICYNLALLPSAVLSVPRAKLAMLFLAGGFSTAFLLGLASCPFSREEKLWAWNHTPGSVAELDRLSGCGALRSLQRGRGQTVWSLFYC